MQIKSALAGAGATVLVGVGVFAAVSSVNASERAVVEPTHEVAVEREYVYWQAPEPLPHITVPAEPEPVVEAEPVVEPEPVAPEPAPAPETKPAPVKEEPVVKPAPKADTKRELVQNKNQPDNPEAPMEEVEPVESAAPEPEPIPGQ